MTYLTRLAITLLLAGGMLHAIPAVAHDYTQGSVKIDHPWSRPTPPGVPTGVGYLAITNTGDSDITLTGARTPQAAAVSLHQSTMSNGMMGMAPVAGGLTIKSGETVELKPHSYHLMLESLSEPLKPGERVPLTLEFEGSADVDVVLHVEPLDGADMDRGMDHSAHQMGGGEQ